MKPISKPLGALAAISVAIGMLFAGTGTAFAADGDIALDATNFPDSAFLTCLENPSQSYLTVDKNHDGMLSTEERNNVSTIKCNAGDFESDTLIKSVEGIEYFPNLTQLFVTDNALTSLDFSQNPKLEQVYATNNPLTSIDVTKNPELTGLYLTQNKLTSLDVSNNSKLTDLYVHSNQLTNLDISHNPRLEEVDVGDNALTSLDVSGNTVLTSLNVAGNALSSLDISHNPRLEEVRAEENNLTSLGTGSTTYPSLAKLYGYRNQLSDVDTTRMPNLTELDVAHNQLSSLDLSQNSQLRYVSAGSNALIAAKANENARTVTINGTQFERHYKGTTFDLTSLQSAVPWFDPSQVSNVEGANLEGTSLTGLQGDVDVSYSYAMGGGSTLTAHLRLIGDDVPPAPTYFTVSFDTRGGSSVESQSVESGKTASEPAAPSRDGYTFDGWYTAASGGSRYDFDATPVTGDLALYAHWTEVPPAPSHATVWFDSVGGSSVSSQSVEVGKPVSRPADPSRDGYVFDGWYTERTGGEEYDFSAPVNGNVTLYAHWTRKQAEKGALKRLAGATRYETMGAVVSAGFPGRSEYVVVASGDNFPDALSASSLAGGLKAPIVLTGSGGLNAVARERVRASGASKAVVIGSTVAVSAAAASELRSMGLSVDRIQGSNRYDTNVEVYKAGRRLGVDW
ncbi:InlB B-repeat-containing protein, partial [Bifidobacterium parmae]